MFETKCPNISDKSKDVALPSQGSVTVYMQINPRPLRYKGNSYI